MTKSLAALRKVRLAVIGLIVIRRYFLWFIDESGRDTTAFAVHAPTDAHLTEVEVFVRVRRRPSFDTWMFTELGLPALASTFEEIEAIA